MFDICNYYEQLVADQLWHLKETAEEPLTQTFLEDVACLALNSLPSCYVRSLVDKGSNMTEQDHVEMRQAVIAAVAKALLKVKQHPHDLRQF